MGDVAESLSRHGPVATYAVAALLLAAEVGTLIGVAIPAAPILVALGALSRGGFLDLPVAMSVAFAAALLGDTVGYWEGRIVGPRIRHTRLGRRIGPLRWGRAERTVLRGGGVAVTVGRLMAVVRTLVPRLVGAAGLDYRRFLLFNTAGVALEVLGMILVGYLSGAALAVG
jgi:membrane protein DedA with SNARE-associated domain